MCIQAGNCEEVKQVKDQRRSDITKYWSVISGLVALLITIVVFYANATNAMERVQDHEARIRVLEKTIISSETLLKQISSRVLEIDNKLDKHIERQIKE